MNPGGLVLIVFSIIGISQLFAGNALERLKILPSTAGQTPTTTPPAGTTPQIPGSTTPYGTGPYGVAPFGDHGGAPAPGTTPQGV
jgi:hypothetical protein